MGEEKDLGRAAVLPCPPELPAEMRTVQGVARLPDTRTRVASAPGLALRGSRGPSLLLKVDSDGAIASDLRERGCLYVGVPSWGWRLGGYSITCGWTRAVDAEPPGAAQIQHLQRGKGTVKTQHSH